MSALGVRAITHERCGLVRHGTTNTCGPGFCCLVCNLHAACCPDNPSDKWLIDRLAESGVALRLWDEHAFVSQ